MTPMNTLRVQGPLRRIVGLRFAARPVQSLRIVLKEYGMEQEVRKDFDKEAAQWDANPGRVKLASDVAAAIIREIHPSGDMKVLDFGCGTGLLTLKLRPLVKAITGADSSQGMLGMLRHKIETQGLANVHTQFVDFEKGEHVAGGYDLIVSSMVAHHVPDTLALFKEWFSLLLPGGQLCFADLDTEDGAFHGDNTGVFHLGFDRNELRQLLQQAGFRDIRDTTATFMSKEVEGQGVREFSIFLISATKG
jgi:2-polyprenyl-3-methyl-5-hydroxy-6-metoxy-1,4-benzoquinol methylase